MPSIKKRGNSFRIMVSMGYDMNGKQIRKTTTFTPPDGVTEGKAEKLARAYAYEFEQRCRGMTNLDENIRFHELFEWYYDQIAPHKLKEYTLESSRYILETYVLPYIGNMKLKDINTARIDALFNELHRHGSKREMYILKDETLLAHGCRRPLSRKSGVNMNTLRDMANGKAVMHSTAERVAQACGRTLKQAFTLAESGGGLEDGTIARVRTALSPIFSTAVKKELLLKNPVMNATTPKDTDTEERAYLDAEHCKELLTIINEFSNPQLTRLIRVLLFTGMRVGEITGLHWADVDFEHSTLTVRYSLYRSKGQYKLGTPKTKSSARIISLPPQVMETLAEQMHWQEQRKLDVGSRWIDRGTVFTGEYGEYISCTISGTFSKYFDDFRIYGLKIMKNTTRLKNDCFSDALLPPMNREQMELQAMRLIKKGYGYSYHVYGTQRISPVAIANALGIRIFFVRLSEDSSVRGVYVMEDTEILIYDDKTKSPKYSKVKGKTILIEKNLRGQDEVVRFTIMHELVHAYVQRFAFYLMAMSRRAFFEMRCPVRINDDQQFLDAFTEKLERQADMIAAYTLMPKESFKKKVSEIQSSYGALRNSACIKEIVDKTASHFGVSISAARRRMLELGFHEVQGVYNFMDGKYVPPFGFKNGSLQPHQTYCVSEEWAKKLLASNKKLLKMVAKGVICFVENHFILNDPNFLTTDKQLTPYGREHLHECALKFNLCYQEKNNFSHRSDSNIAFRAVDSVLPITMLYADDNTDIEEKARNLCKRNTAVLELVKSMPEDFGESLTQVVKWTHKTREEIANDCWIQ